MARTSPVYGFMATTLPLTAWCDSTAAASSRSATNCSRASIVSVTGVPGRGSVASCESIPRRFTSVSSRTFPGCPRSSGSSAFSMPAFPRSSKSTPPSRCAASVPLG